MIKQPHGYLFSILNWRLQKTKNQVLVWFSFKFNEKNRNKANENEIFQALIITEDKLTNLFERMQNYSQVVISFYNFTRLSAATCKRDSDKNKVLIVSLHNNLIENR